ncbi:hypothetical protein V8G54_019352 [Vigna mungo]|uniref:Uncharacterized protein n=1 Tax=Vigna mungo TaxID=3915 RepID=A0AAQ3NBT3_VIGMU
MLQYNIYFSCNKLFHGSNKVSHAPKSHARKHTYPPPHNRDREVMVFIIEMTITLLNKVCGFLVFALNGATFTDPLFISLDIDIHIIPFPSLSFSFPLSKRKKKKKHTHTIFQIFSCLESLGCTTPYTCIMQLPSQGPHHN